MNHVVTSDGSRHFSSSFLIALASLYFCLQNHRLNMFSFLIGLCLYCLESITPTPRGTLWCPLSLLTFDSNQCFKGSALCPLPFDLSEVYLYNCPYRYEMHIREGAGAASWSLSGHLLASCSSILLKASTAAFPCPQSHTVLVSMSELLMVHQKYFIGQSWPLTEAMQTLTP